MPILRTEYSTKFDLKSVANSHAADLLFEGYKKEFIDDKPTIDRFVSLSLNLINDFLHSRFDERTVGMLIHRLLVDASTSCFFEEPYSKDHNQLLALLIELMDSDWAKDGDSYAEYHSEFGERFAELLRKYT